MTSRERIAKAVNNDEWQDVRRSMKGIDTGEKMKMLKWYWNVNTHGHTLRDSMSAAEAVQTIENCDVCVRVDNYIKALCRGGQLYAGESLMTVLGQGWNPPIRK